MGREYPILGENSVNGMFPPKIAPFPFTANITESGWSGQKSSLTVKIPELRCLCRTCHYKAKIIKTKCFGRNSHSRANPLNLGCKVHKYFSQIVVLRSRSPNFGRKSQCCFVCLENAPILGENPKIWVLRSTMQHLRLKSRKLVLLIKNPYHG